MSDVLAIIGIITWTVLITVVAVARFGPPMADRFGYASFARRLERFRHTVRRYASIGTPDSPPHSSGANPRHEA